jgi:hypothetical protein
VDAFRCIARSALSRDYAGTSQAAAVAKFVRDETQDTD